MGNLSHENAHDLLFGQLSKRELVRVELGEFESISLGFGEKEHLYRSIIKQREYREVEIGSYRSNWFLSRTDGVQKKGKYAVELISYNQSLRGVFSRPPTGMNLKQKTVSILFGNYSISFEDDGVLNDEMFHAFMLNGMHLEYARGVWTFQAATRPRE